MKNIPTNSLIEKYLPADYVDSYSREIVCNQKITPEKFRNLAFNQLPKWIDWLMNLRNAIAKPLGLDTKSRFTNMVSDKNEHEEILECLTATWIFMFQCGVVNIKIANRNLGLLLL